MLGMERAWMDRHNAEPPAKLFVGAMLEVPGLVWQLDALLPLTDFPSTVVTIFSSLCLPQTEETGFRPLRRSLARDVRRYQGCGDGVIPQACQCLSAVKWRAARSKRWRFSGFNWSLPLSPSLFGAVKAMTLTVNTEELRLY